MFYLLTFTFGLFGCSGNSEKTADKSLATEAASKEVKLRKLRKLFVIGDFDDDAQKDTIFQHNYSRQTRSEIEYSADPFQNEWDTVVKWFFEQDPDIFLTMHETNPDTLHLGEGQGLYCLINLGDNNADGKDEVALVMDNLDFSNVTSCRIYALCNNKWTRLKTFDVLEDAFDFTTDQAPIFENIDGYLEKQDGAWYCKSFDEKMERLELDRCK